MSEVATRRELFASRRSRIDPFIVMEVLAAANAVAAAGREVLHLEVGEPGGGPPRSVLKAAKDALDHCALGYTEAFGLPALRRKIARYYQDWYGLDVPVERIALTAGASGAFVLGFLAAFDAGARVAIADPGYPAYRNILRSLDVEVVNIAADESTRFQPTSGLLRREGSVEGLVLASPANPTGTMIADAELRSLAIFCRERGIRLVSDEIYHGITYEEPATTVLAHAPDALIVNSFSKYFCMTGWRLGWLVVPEDLVAPVTKLAQNLYIAPSTIAQHAALAAFDATPELDARVERYRRNRDILRNALAPAGLDRLAPADGAFYLYAEVSRFTDDSVALCRRLLHETGVAATPGVDFDPLRGHHYIRFSFAGEEAVIKQASRRLAEWFGARR